MYSTYPELAFDDFGQLAGHTRCINCGCRADDHKGGSPENPAHTCPATATIGVPKAFPRTTLADDRASRAGDPNAYREWDKRINEYWSAPTVFACLQGTPAGRIYVNIR